VQKLPAAQQKIKVITSTKHRAGKVVTLITNFVETEEEKEKLAKQLKTFCGTGGSYKDGEIIIQGDHRDKVLQWLIKQGYLLAKKV
jgi:translation initiation factor 1